jgi:transcriptional regulator with XRE-family HTH domain
MVQLSEEEFLKNLGLKIKAIRIEQGLSLNKLAKNYGFEKASLSRTEAGKSNITLKTLFKLSTALNVSVSRFFTDEKV